MAMARQVINEVLQIKEYNFRAAHQVNHNAKSLFQDLYNPIYFSKNYIYIYCIHIHIYTTQNVVYYIFDAS